MADPAHPAQICGVAWHNQFRADGNNRVRGTKRDVLIRSPGFVLSVLVTAANVHDKHAAGWPLDRAAENRWAPNCVKVDGIYAGPRIDDAAGRHGLDVQVTLGREAKAVIGGG